MLLIRLRGSEIRRMDTFPVLPQTPRGAAWSGGVAVGRGEKLQPCRRRSRRTKARMHLGLAREREREREEGTQTEK